MASSLENGTCGAIRSPGTASRYNDLDVCSHAEGVVPPKSEVVSHVGPDPVQRAWVTKERRVGRENGRQSCVSLCRQQPILYGCSPFGIAFVVARSGSRRAAKLRGRRRKAPVAA